MITGFLALALAVAECPPAHGCVTLEGQLRRGERLSRPFGPGLVLVLEPRDHGWEIVVRDERPEENIARLTPPFHFVANPRYIEGWHFRNIDNTGPNNGSLNAPAEEREFVFSPAVGRSIEYPPTAEQMRVLEQSGRGRLIIRSLELGNLRPARKAYIERLAFTVRLSWPSSWETRGPLPLAPE